MKNLNKPFKWLSVLTLFAVCTWVVLQGLVGPDSAPKSSTVGDGVRPSPVESVATVNSDLSLVTTGKPSPVSVDAGTLVVDKGGNLRNVLLLADFNKSRSLRSYVNAALNRVELGGFHSALAAIELCFGNDLLGVSGVEKQALTESILAGQAKALLRARCDLDLEEKDRMVSAIFRSDKFKLISDPLFEVSQAMLDRDRDHASRLEFAKNLVNSRNPFAMYSLLSLADDGPSSDNKEPPFYYAGKYYREPTDIRSLHDAWLLAQCQFGLDCGSEALSTLRLCADRGWCGQNVHEAVGQGDALSGRPPGSSVMLASRIVASIQSGDLAAFVPPDKSPSP
jgi:hypothetical protein